MIMKLASTWLPLKHTRHKVAQRFESRNGVVAQSIAKEIQEFAEEWHQFYYLNHDYLV